MRCIKCPAPKECNDALVCVCPAGTCSGACAGTCTAPATCDAASGVCVTLPFCTGTGSAKCNSPATCRCPLGGPACDTGNNGGKCNGK